MFGKILVFPWFKWLAIIFNILEEAFFACLFAFGSHMLQLDTALVQNSFMFLACVWFFTKFSVTAILIANSRFFLLCSQL